MSRVRLDDSQFRAMDFAKFLTATSQFLVERGLAKCCAFERLNIHANQCRAFLAQSLRKVAQQLINTVFGYCLLHDEPRISQRRFASRAMTDYPRAATSRSAILVESNWS